MIDICFIKNDQQIDSEESLVFKLKTENNESNVNTDIEKIWNTFSGKELSPIIEDLLIIGVAVFSTDKKISRLLSKENWGRKFNIKIPVLELEKWIEVQNELEETLSFLSGDEWNIIFYHTSERFRRSENNQLEFDLGLDKDFDSVSLFSGGIDSFCGALSLMDNRRNPLYVGFKEYPLLIEKQWNLFDSIKKHYNNQEIDFIQFNVLPKTPKILSEINSDMLVNESTSRTRSFLFITSAISAASIIGEDIPVYIPENGFIGINVPLTSSRNGSCSTRTTHPNFLRSINNLLIKLGINNKIENFYSDLSKGQIVSLHKNNDVFEKNYKFTLSCSHPCQSRYDKVTPPINCGYCYPCLIRRASLLVNDFDDNHYNPLYNLNREFIEKNNDIEEKASDLKALLYSVRRFQDHEDNDIFIRGLLRQQGLLLEGERNSYKNVYRKSMDELTQFINYTENLAEYTGLLE